MYYSRTPLVRLLDLDQQAVSVDGVATKALVDTGSPATIVSLKFILKVLAGQKIPNQTVQENVRRKFLTPDIASTELWGTSTCYPGQDMCKPVAKRAASKGQRVHEERCSEQPSVRNRYSTTPGILPDRGRRQGGSDGCCDTSYLCCRRRPIFTPRVCS